MSHHSQRGSPNIAAQPAKQSRQMVAGLSFADCLPKSMKMVSVNARLLSNFQVLNRQWLPRESPSYQAARKLLGTVSWDVRIVEQAD